MMTAILRLSAAMLAGSLLTWAGGALALDYRSVGTPSAIMYERPTLKSKKLYVVSRYTPLEQVVDLSKWAKVRGQDGKLAWVEKRVLVNTRYVVVTTALADVFQQPDTGSALVFRVRKQVALEVLEDTRAGWLKVRHQDGTVGYIRSRDVWGAS